MQLLPMADAVHPLIAGSMSHVAAGFAVFAQAAAPVAVVALWQGAAVAVAMVLCLRLAPRVSAGQRFAAWAAGFAVVVGLPFLSLLAHSSAVGAAGALPLQQEAARPFLQLDSRWGFILAALWLAASVLRAAGLGFHSLRLRKLWKSAAPVEVDSSLRSLLAAPSSARPIAICTTRELDRPSVIGFFSPRILVPEWLFGRLTPGELEQVILHEAEHLRRRDDWSNLLQKLSLVLFPLNPALVWMERRLCREREMACDEGVVRRTQAPRAYAACLASLAERGLERRQLLRRAHALSLGAFEQRPELVRRVHSILWRKQALHPLAARALVGAVGCGLLFGSVELARCPQMVAFVAAPKLDTQAASYVRTQSSPSGIQRASYAPASQPRLQRATTGFRVPAGVRAIETKAILPASRSAAAPLTSASVRRNAHPSPTASEYRIVAADAGAGAPRQVLLNAETPTSAAPAPEQQFIVFAAWEVVRTSAPKSVPVADYDTGASAESQVGDAAGQPGSESATQVTITQLILAVYPAGVAPAGSAPSPKATHATGSDSRHPAALPFGNGWLVFQL
jgi:beta-lactamase regulating signal transducer with metallopeptidase domain